MAVYTQLAKAEIEIFLQQYNVGRLVSFKGITEGVENTNYLLVLDSGGNKVRYILTLYEQRVNPDDLPFFMGLTEWLSQRAIPCPMPVKGLSGEVIHHVKGKPAALIQYLDGLGSPHITPAHLTLTGGLMARMHLATKGFGMERRNALSVDGWKALYARFAAHADDIVPGLRNEMQTELDYLAVNWPSYQQDGLPAGAVHADIFPDNVFFMDGNTDQPQLSGIIDFYFACNDFWIYDLVICMNAWCFDNGRQFVRERARALWQAYNAVRPVTREECAVMPLMARGASMRFLVTRAYDWLNRVPGALVNPKDPMEYVAKLRFHQSVKDWNEYGLT